MFRALPFGIAIEAKKIEENQCEIKQTMVLRAPLAQLGERAWRGQVQRKVGCGLCVGAACEDNADCGDDGADRQAGRQAHRQTDIKRAAATGDKSERESASEGWG